MPGLDVIGNIAIDHTRYPDGRSATLLGGAALHTAIAAHRAGLRATPVSVIGADLEHLPDDPRMAGLDFDGLAIGDGPSARFTIDYDTDADVSSLTAEYGASHALTQHSLRWIGGHRAHMVHVCCRKPLDVAAVLSALTGAGRWFSVDFVVSSARQMITAATPFLPQAATVFVNAGEHAHLADAVPARQLRLVVISDGPRRARVLRRGQPTAQAQPPLTDSVEVTGAGDTLAGTFLAVRAAGASDRAALHRAVAAASAHLTAPPLTLTQH